MPICFKLFACAIALTNAQAIFVATFTFLEKIAAESPRNVARANSPTIKRIIYETVANFFIFVAEFHANLKSKNYYEYT